MSRRGESGRGQQRSYTSPPMRVSNKPLKAESIQCFERRHADCNGTCAPFFPGPCECECHATQRPTLSEGGQALEVTDAATKDDADPKETR